MASNVKADPPKEEGKASDEAEIKVKEEHPPMETPCLIERMDPQNWKNEIHQLKNDVLFWRISSKKIGSKRMIITPPLYFCNYAFQIFVTLHVQGARGFMDVFLQTTRGHFDNALSWPFTGQVTIEVFNGMTSSELKQGGVLISRPHKSPASILILGTSAPNTHRVFTTTDESSRSRLGFENYEVSFAIDPIIRIKIESLKHSEVAQRARSVYGNTFFPHAKSTNV